MRKYKAMSVSLDKDSRQYLETESRRTGVRMSTIIRQSLILHKKAGKNKVTVN